MVLAAERPSNDLTNPSLNARAISEYWNAKQAAKPANVIDFPRAA